MWRSFSRQNRVSTLGVFAYEAVHLVEPLVDFIHRGDDGGLKAPGVVSLAVLERLEREHESPSAAFIRGLGVADFVLGCKQAAFLQYVHHETVMVHDDLARSGDGRRMLGL